MDPGDSKAWFLEWLEAWWLKAILAARSSCVLPLVYGFPGSDFRLISTFEALTTRQRLCLGSRFP